MVKELAWKAWIACDENGICHLFLCKKPTKTKQGYWFNHSVCFGIPLEDADIEELFGVLPKWSDEEPIEIDDIIIRAKQ